MSLRQSFLTKGYSNFYYILRACMVYTHMYIHATYTCMVHLLHYDYNTICQSESQHEVQTITVCQAFIMNSDGRGSQTSQKKRASGC